MWGSVEIPGSLNERKMNYYFTSFTVKSMESFYYSWCIMFSIGAIEWIVMMLYCKVKHYAGWSLHDNLETFDSCDP